MKNKGPLLEVQNLHKEFYIKPRGTFKRQTLKAVNGLSIAIEKGDIFGLVGESGCGKSTAGQVIAGILPKTRGNILYNGQILPSKPDKYRHKNIQMIFQDPYAALNPKKTIGWIIEEPLKIHFSYDRHTRRALVAEMMEMTGLGQGFIGAYPCELSGGQRQRANIAATLMLKSSFVIADESVSALDVSVQSQILNLLTDLKEKMDLTYLFISHDLNVIRYLSNRIGVMYMGQLVETGDCALVCQNPAHPYTRMLLSAVPTLTGSPARRINPLGEIPNPLDPPSGCPFHTRCERAMVKCREENPPMNEISPNHFASCHFI